jgi:hypothetical protein
MANRMFGLCNGSCWHPKRKNRKTKIHKKDIPGRKSGFIAMRVYLCMKIHDSPFNSVKQEDESAWHDGKNNGC